MADAITGSIENGRRAQVALPFYSGVVGVRERGDAIELAWFGLPVAFAGPVEGTLDGQRIRVTAVRARGAGASQALVAAAERV